MYTINKRTRESIHSSSHHGLAVILKLILLGLVVMGFSGAVLADAYKGKKMPPYPKDFVSLDERLSKDQKKVILWVKLAKKHMLWVAQVHKLVENKPPEMTVTSSTAIAEMDDAEKTKHELVLYGCKSKEEKENESATVVIVDPKQKDPKAAVKKAWLVNFTTGAVKSIASSGIECDTSDAAGDDKDAKAAVKEDPKVMACGKKEINANDTLELKFGAAKSAKTGLTVLSPKGDLFLLAYPASKETKGSNFKPIMEHKKFLGSKSLSIKIKDVTAPFFTEQSEKLAGNKKVFSEKGDYLFVLGESESESGGVSCVVNLK